MGKMTTMAHFLLEEGCKDYTFLYKVVDDEKLVWILFFADNMKPPHLDASLEELDANAYLVPSGCL